MPIVSANGETIHYVKDGSGPAVALIHGIGASVAQWRAQIAVLKDRHTVVAFDCRGHGQSSANGKVGPEETAADLKAVLDAAGVTRCHLVGVSTGGQGALKFAARFPAAVQSLVLAGTFAKPVDGNAERVAATKEAIAYISMQEFGNQYAGQTLLPSTSLDAQDELADAVAKVAPKVYNETMAAAFLGDVTSTLASVTAPTLVLVGDQDEVAPRAAAELIVNGVRGARLEIVPDAGHLINLDNPDAFNAAVTRFIHAAG